MTSQPYQYKSLAPEGNPIRILTLWPAKWEDEIRCTIQHADLDHKPSYRALSYTWGDANDTRQILLQNRPFLVTKNLEIALRYLRHMYSQEAPETFWIDAICINQADLQERSAQVRKMRQIFTDAQQVVAWTGEADPDTDEAFDLYDEASRIKDPTTILSIETILLENRQDFDLAARNWTALDHFLSRPYWSRVWVVPELSARFYHDIDPETRTDACLILCGFRKVSWGLFWIACCLRFRANVEDSAALDYPPGLHMFTMIENSSAGETRLSEVVFRASHLEASDTRDKVYALKSLVTQEDQGFPIDYTKSVDQVYEDLVKFCISKEQNLQILEGESFLLHEVKEKPSWTRLVRSRNAGRSFGRRNGSPGGDALMSVTFDEQRKLLIAEGLLAGTVKKVLGPFYDSQEAWSSMLSSLRDQMISNPSHDYMERQLCVFAAHLDREQQDCLCRAITLDQDLDLVSWSSCPALPLTVQVIRAWLGLETDVTDAFYDEKGQTKHPRDTMRQVHSNLTYRCVFMLESGHIGLGPRDIREEDIVAILYGGSTCFTLRPSAADYELQGIAYVQGIMNGELIEDLGEDGKPKGTRKFVIR